MDKQIQHIEQSIRDKFDNFAPAPPPQIWEGIQKGLAAQTKPAFYVTYGKQIAVAASILLLASLGLWWFFPNTSDNEAISESTVNESNNITENQTINSDKADIKESSEEFIEKSPELNNNENQVGVISSTSEDQIAEVQSQDETTTTDNNQVNEEVVMKSFSDTQSSTNSGLAANQSALSKMPVLSLTSISSIASISLALDTEGNVLLTKRPPVATEVIFENPSKSNSRWTSGIYITPEFMLNDFDSVQLLPTYSLNYEPTYHFSNHFFLRFGLGMSYARDQGFAKLDYVSNDVVGTYENVYDITFDSIDGLVVPTYHTKTTDIWDSVRHMQVTDVTNKYFYIQTPVLFGYYKKNTKFNWYFYAGPAFNVLVSKQIEDPNTGLEDVQIIDLTNNLPERSPYFMQLWVGAGIEYKVGRQVAVAVEPNYRYYFNNVFKEDDYKSALSSFSLRFGVVFTMK